MSKLLFIETLNIWSTLLLSIGGAGTIIFGLSKWFGEKLAKIYFDNHRFRHEKDLERIKTKYSTELEITKSELEKSKAQFYRYSEKQFELYNSLWIVLWELKKKADELWEKADPREIPKFSEKVRLAREAINLNILIIEEHHYEALNNILTEFENFRFGKQNLVNLRNKTLKQVQEAGISHNSIRLIISQNEFIKQKYDELIYELARLFRTQIKG